MACSCSICMGKGDIKTKKGKITNGSFGKKRPYVAKKADAEGDKKNNIASESAK